MGIRSNQRLHWFCFTMLCDWSRKLAPPSQPITYKFKLKQITTLSLTFSYSYDRLHVFALSSCRLLIIFTCVLIGCCDYFGFHVSILHRKVCYTVDSSYHNPGYLEFEATPCALVSMFHCNFILDISNPQYLKNLLYWNQVCFPQR